MTLTCPGETCPFCTGEACSVCSAARRAGGPAIGECQHGPVERHSGMPAISESRTPTKPLPPIEHSITVDFADGAQVAEFLETIARVMRERGSVTFVLRY